MQKKFAKISEKTIDSNPYWDYKIDEYISPKEKVELYYYAHTPGSTMIIPIIEQKFLFTIQYRYLNQRVSIEFPGGGAKKNLTPIENATLELLQETGYLPNNIQQIGIFNPCNGLTDEICYVFLANELVKKEQSLDETEEIELMLLSEKEVTNKIKTGEIWDGMTLASWCLFKSLQLHY